MDRTDLVKRARESYERHEWADAYARLSEADREGSLEPDDLMSLAFAAYLIGKDAESIEILTRTHRQALERNDARGAVRCAFWIGFQLINKGDAAQAGGWFARGHTILEENDSDCVERGYLLIPVALQDLFGGEASTAHRIFGEVSEIGRRFHDRDLITLGGFGGAQSLIRMGRPEEGMTRFDEVMVGVTSGEVSAVVSGLVYCGVIAACQDVFDVRRAHEWTKALADWCAAQPDLVPYRGQCMVHRAQLMQMQGAWPAAIEEATKARDQLFDSPARTAVGMAYYQLGELHRLRGEFDEAEDGYREASHWGHSPQPGLAMLRLAQGDTAAAASAIRREVDEARDVVVRSRILPAHVEIMLAVDDLASARRAAEDLARLADDAGAPLLRAFAAHAVGAVLLAEGDAGAALAALREACAGWRGLDAPYEAARARVLIGLACRALGDEDTASLEIDAARRVFKDLGAVPDHARVEQLAPLVQRESAGLTGRELEVLALVATGKPNREIAADLVLSEKTVARHISNIFTKLGVSSRAAATAHAFKHDLV